MLSKRGKKTHQQKKPQNQQNHKDMCWGVKCQHQTDFPGATRQASWTEETMSFAPWIEISSIHATRKSLKILTF